ncbi:hypothetical protein HOY82DRAFT_577910 [Tuber indicum]|nr:hypothetical protein HOY82DRAFT_577910 [Tuber indicum]
MWISRSSPTKETDRPRGDEDGAGASVVMHHDLERPRDFRFLAAVLSHVVFSRGSDLCNVWVEYHQCCTARYCFCSNTCCDSSEQPQLPEDCGTQ